MAHDFRHVRDHELRMLAQIEQRLLAWLATEPLSDLERRGVQSRLRRCKRLQTLWSAAQPNRSHFDE